MKHILIQKNILQNNDDIARKNRRLLKEKGIYTINLLGSPGSGKTALLEQIIANMKDKVNMLVIEGDLYTTKDAERIEKQNINVIQVNTGGACHLDAAMIRQALDCGDLQNTDLLVIENVGNLVCPASYDLSEDMRITVLSVTEGNDKPLKYPAVFHQSQAIVLNKMDMLALTNFSKEEFYKDVRLVNEDVDIFEVSCTTGEGINSLCTYLEAVITSQKGSK